MDFLLELKRMGIDVLSLAEQARQKNEDRLHTHAEQAMDRHVDFAKHLNDNEVARIQAERPQPTAQ